MKTYTVINRFHNTSAKTTLDEDDYLLAGYPRMSKEQKSINRRAKRLERNLCGSPQCKCSGMFRWIKVNEVI